MPLYLLLLIQRGYYSSEILLLLKRVMRGMFMCITILSATSYLTLQGMDILAHLDMSDSEFDYRLNVLLHF